MKAKCKPVAGRIDCVQQIRHLLLLVANHVQDWAKHLSREPPGICQLEDAWRHVEAMTRGRAAIVQARLSAQPADMCLQTIAGLAVDDRSDMSLNISRISDMEFAGGPRDHLDHAICYIVLNAEQPQRRTTLTG